MPAGSHPSSWARLTRSYCRVMLPMFSRTCEPRRLTHVDHGVSAQVVRTDFEGLRPARHGMSPLFGAGSETARPPHSRLTALRGQLREFADQQRDGSRYGPACSAPEGKRRMGTCSNLLDGPKPYGGQRALSYVICSALWLALVLLLDPLCDPPQSLNREQGWVHGGDIRVGRPVVVSQARCNGSVITIGQANDEVGICSSAHSYELDALAMQRMVRVSHGHPFHRRFAKGGSAL